MCLAEALLRVPDEQTADRLIAEKIRTGDWGAHKGRTINEAIRKTERRSKSPIWSNLIVGHY